MRYIVLSILWIFQSCTAIARETGGGSRADALGGAYTAVGGDIWGITFNAGALSRLGRSEASFFYSPSPFGLKELSVKACAFAVRVPSGVIGIAAGKFGYELYQELSGTISYATSIPVAGFGASLRYHAIRISRYGSAAALGLDAGTLVDVPGGMRFGLSVQNVTAASLGVAREPIPQVYAIGVSYTPAENVLLAADFKKESGQEAFPNFGLEYRIADALAVRVGLPGAGSAYTGGLGVHYSPVQIDYAFAVHRDLGWTQEVTLSVNWGSRHD